MFSKCPTLFLFYKKHALSEHELDSLCWRHSDQNLNLKIYTYTNHLRYAIQLFDYGAFIRQQMPSMYELLLITLLFETPGYCKGYLLPQYRNSNYFLLQPDTHTCCPPNHRFSDRNESGRLSTLSYSKN